jgi:hypothetical protein
MFWKRVAAITFVAQLGAVAAFAQEYGRSSGGELQLFRKQQSRLSGSFSLTQSRSGVFGDNLKGYDATLGGTLVPDRLWFFGSFQHTDVPRFDAVLPQIEPLSASSGKIDANLGDRQSLQAIAVRSAVATPSLSLVPASFLSLHATQILSDNAFVTMSVSQSTTHR